jgi:hypothetical protein
MDDAGLHPILQQGTAFSSTFLRCAPRTYVRYRDRRRASQLCAPMFASRVAGGVAQHLLCSDRGTALTVNAAPQIRMKLPWKKNGTLEK